MESPYEELPLSSFDDICRTCLLYNDDLYMIDEVEWEGIKLVEILKSAYLEVLEDDQFPQQMCKDCIKLMYQTRNFLCKCLISKQTVDRIIERESFEVDAQTESDINDTSDQNCQTSNPDQNYSYTNIENAPGDYTYEVTYIKCEILSEDSEVEETLYIEVVSEVVDNETINEENPNNLNLLKIINQENQNKTNMEKIINHENQNGVSLEKILQKENQNEIYLQKTPEVVSEVVDNETINEENPNNLNLLKIINQENQNKTNLEKIINHENQNGVNLEKILQKENQNEINLQKKPQLKTKRKGRLRNNGLFRCLSCAKLFNTLEEMEKHKNETHKKNFKYQCGYCKSKFASKLHLTAHIRIHTREKPFQCSICNEKFTFKNVLRRHMNTHLKEKPFRCEFCERSFTRKYELDQHEREHKNTKLICEYCSEEFQSPLALAKHNRNVHECSRENIFQCDVCGNILRSEQTLQEHMTLHGPRNFQCESCGKAFSSNRNLKLHIRYTHHDAEFACNFCDNKYKQRNSLLKHQQQHKEKFICDICSAIFVYKSSLSQHMRIHMGDTKYQCKECKTVCMNKRRLESHIRSYHTKEKPFCCPTCEKCFSDKANLFNHQKIHKERLNCNICHESFKDIESVKAHISVHHA